MPWEVMCKVLFSADKIEPSRSKPSIDGNLFVQTGHRVVLDFELILGPPCYLPFKRRLDSRLKHAGMTDFG